MADTTSIVLGLIAGLALFLYGVNVLSDELRVQGGDRMRSLLQRFTRNRAAGVATGTVATTLLDSSSVTIILVISLVNAGLLAFEHSIAVIMGSNIGTTISSQLFAFDIDEYSPVILGVGLVSQVLATSSRVRSAGRILFAFGLLFFGLHYIGQVVEPLKSHSAFLEMLKQVEAPVYGVAVGALFTILVQSSSATMGIVITLASQDMISLAAGLALMLGAEIGTCADTLIATIGRSRPAVRAGMFHLMFNVATVALGVALVHPLADLAAWISGGAGVARQIANAHVLFNVGGVALTLGFVHPIARVMKRVIPEERLAPAGNAEPVHEIR